MGGEVLLAYGGEVLPADGCAGPLSAPSVDSLESIPVPNDSGDGVVDTPMDSSASPGVAVQAENVDCVMET